MKKEPLTAEELDELTIIIEELDAGATISITKGNMGFDILDSLNEKIKNILKEQIRLNKGEEA